MDIIIAEDEPVTRLLLEETLSGWGYKVRAVEDGREVLALLEKKPKCQLFLIDWSMPNMNGIDLCKELKGHTDFLRYVVMLTSKDGTENIVEAMEAGADDYVTKPFSPEELKARVRAGRRIIEKERQLEHYANFDALTGIWNRRMILKKLENEWDRSQRENMNLSILMLDLDKFKRINDTHGHQVGDLALKHFCGVVSKLIRPYDYFGRYGGEEFLLVLPMAHYEYPIQISERIRQAVEKSELVLDDGTIIKLTVSIGVTSRQVEDVTPDNALQRADSAAYEAKNNGRNQVKLLLK